MTNKRGYYYSTDALIAVVVIFLVIFALKPLGEKREIQVNVQEDLISVLSNLKMGEVNDSYFQELISSGEASENITILEQIVELYAKDSPEAENLINYILINLKPEENIGVWVGNDLIASVNKTSYESSTEIWTSRELVSGIKKTENGDDVKGYSARAFLKRTDNIEYYFFGGYVGDGNITILIEPKGKVKDIKIEGAISENFQVYINGNFAGSYNKSPSEIEPITHSLTNYSNLFTSDINTIEFKGNKSLYIAGGHLKISYENSTQVPTSKRYLPGIDGLINIYDSFYIPSNLTSLEFYLHYTSPVDLFLVVGNETIYEGRGENVQQTITNAEIISKINYKDLIKKTIPLRIGLEEINYVGETITLDLISVTDLSKYMRCSIFQYGPNKNQCNTANGIWMLPANYSEEANKLLINEILYYAGNQMGFIGLGASENPVLSHPLSTNKNSLLSTVDRLSLESSYDANNLRLCSGITSATQEFVSNANSNAIRVMIVMLAGQISTPPCNIATIDLNQDGTINSLDDAIKASCDAYNVQNITIHTIGYGDIVDTNTLSAMAACANGTFTYQPNVSELVDTYQEVIDKILIQYKFQTAKTSTGVHTKLYPDSYIKMEYEKEETPFGLVINLEEQFTSASIGTLNVPNNTEVEEVKVISYSGAKWTNEINLYNNENGWDNIFKLSDFGQQYIKIGDPYNIIIPKDKIKKGANQINLTTGVSPSNSSEGSVFNKIIYTLIKGGLGYSPISASAKGCIWNIEFSDNTNSTIIIPTDYNGTKTCSYTTLSNSYNENDAIANAVYDLLKNLDLDLNGKVDSKFSSQDLSIDSSEISGIPYIISSEVQVRIWR